jgi:Resolvase, N terminal domain
VAKLDRLSRSVAFIATLMNSKGFDLAIADMPGANRLTLHVLAAAAEHERHMIGERTRHALAAAKARGVKLGNPEQAKINQAKAAERAQVLRPHIERCIKAGRTSSKPSQPTQRARHRGTEWRPMVSDAGSSRPPASRPMIEPRGASVAGRETLAEAPKVPPSLTRSACRASASDSTHRTAQSN